MPDPIQTCSPDLNQQEVAALVDHRPQVCAADELLPHHEQSIRSVGDQLPYCNPPVCPVGDHVLPESKKEQVREPPEPTQEELVVKVSEEAGFSKKKKKRWMLVNSLEERPVCDARGRNTAPYCKEFTRPRSIEGFGMVRNIPGTTTIGPVLDIFVFRGSRSHVH